MNYSEIEQAQDNEKERLKVIYVDDMSTSLLTLKRRLSNHHDLYPAESSLELFGTLEKIKADIILLDINIPNVDGYEIIKSLKADKRYAKIPVIFLTSNKDRKSVIKGLTLGAADYLIKPVDTVILIECIEKHAAQSMSENGKEDCKKRSILAVDDVVSVLKTIKAALHTYYKVHTISKPESVLDFLQLRKPELILLDYLMPMLNGFELLPMIREIPGFKDTPVIIMTSAGTVDNIREAVSLGACDFIVKPLKENELNEKVAKHI